MKSGTTAHDTFLQAAIEYANLGYSIFPCSRGDKKPLTEHGCLDATTDEDQIVEWWEKTKFANIGISTNGLLVVDIDGSDNEWLSDPKIMESLSTGAMSQTPSGGRHFIFRQPVNAQFKNTTGKLAPKVDTRADGGYIIAPPSQIGSNAYEWLPSYELNEPLESLTEAPGWIVDNLKEASETRIDLGGKGNPIKHGTQHDTLFRFGCLMRNYGSSYDEINAALQVMNRERCEKPGTVRAIEKIAENAAKYEPDQAGEGYVRGTGEQFVEKKKSLPDPGPFPEELLNVPGFIGDVMKYNLDGAFKPQPVLALAAAITLIGTLTGRKISDRFGTRTNVYCLGVCKSGGGKERARQVNKGILFQSGAGELIGPEGLASHAGLVSAVEKQNCLLLQLDEIGRMIKTMGNAGGSPHLYNIATILMKLFTSSNSLYIGDAYADPDKSKTIDQPHACLYGTTVPQSLYEGLTAENLTDGFLSRMMIFESTDHDPRPTEVAIYDVPSSIKAFARTWFQFNPGGNLSNEHPGPYIVEYDSEAEDIFQQLDEIAYNERKTDNEMISSMWTRTVEKARKLALIYACSKNTQGPRVNMSAAEWACEVSQHLTRKIIFTASDWVAENLFDAMGKKVLRAIKATGKKGITKSGLIGKTRGFRVRERDDIIATLKEGGDIWEKIEDTVTKSATRYFAV
ncbi:bifunctional DNA primase/polymerase [uncultured Gimesia sp.]|uniref:bifunctional DNA primase/polymerase n=1 Tax=uncultured Gimesia sp. TaxID=1678688 RepID=UPI00261FB2DD|nr:bifunctional DNA primase/polymerase [uncultured Gimesia sp.]